jgi:hypothetical protein
MSNEMSAVCQEMRQKWAERGSSWATLEDQITIINEATSHQNSRRDRRLLRAG